MANWKILSQTVTSKGFPREFGTTDPSGVKQRLHFVAAERSGGGSDDVVPRRVMGIGTDRLSARRSLEETITAYDPSARVIPAR